MRSLLVILAVGLILVTEVAVQAEDNVDAQAEAAFKEGIKHFKSGLHIAGAAAFRRANALKPNWKIQYNIGQSEAAAKRYGLALEAFEKYMSEGGDDIAPERQAEVIKEMQRLRELVGSLEINAPKEADITVDGVERGFAPLMGPLMVAAGVEHQVLVKQGNETLLDRTVKVSGGRTTVLNVEQTVTPAQQDETEKKPIAAPETGGGQTSSFRTSGWVFLGAGTAMLVGGVVTGVMTASKANELDDKCPDKQCSKAGDLDLIDSVNTLALATDILLPIGGAIAVTGMVLLIIGYKNTESEDPGALSVAPSFGPGSGGVVFEGRF